VSVTGLPGFLRQYRDKAAILWLLVFFVVFLSWVCVAWLTLPGQHIRVLDIMDFFTAFNGDDGYRYFFYRQAFSDPELYSWDYILPVPMLLDGALLAFFQDDIFSVRVAHAAFAFFSLYLLYRTQRLLGVTRNLAAASVLILALMPVYALHAMSFYAESWLVFFVVLVWFLFASERQLMAAMAASCLPLIRPEGFLLILPLFLYFLSQKKYREFIVLGFAGGIYFFWLLFYLPLSDFVSYFTWHEAYREYINHIQFPVLNNRFGFFVSYNALWYGTAFAWLAFYGWRLSAQPWWRWFIAGNMLFLGAYFALLWSGNLYYEPRYFILVLPMLAIFFAKGLEQVKRKKVFQGHRFSGAVVLTFVFIIANHFLQNDELRNRYFDGKRLPFYQQQGPVYGLEDDRKEVEKLESLLEVVYRAIEEYPQIDVFFMPAYRDIYYLLDPQRLEGVEFVMLPLNYGRHVGIFGGSLFGWHAGGRQYSYYNFYDIRSGAGKKIGLYFGNMKGCSACVSLAYKEDRGVYAVYYEERDRPMRIPDEGEIIVVSPTE